LQTTILGYLYLPQNRHKDGFVIKLYFMKKFLSIILTVVLFGKAKSQSITVTYPNGGDTLFNCNTDTIRFTATGTSTFYNIDYSVNGGTTWQSVITNIKIINGKYAWTVPINVQHSSSSLIRVYDRSNTTIRDSSNAVFNIFKPITITSPNGGEVLNGYTYKTLTWNMYSKSTSNNFSILYSINGGASFTFVAGINTAANSTSGSYNWLVPTIAANTQCLIRVQDNSNTCKVDVSNAFFTINPPLPLIKSAGGAKVFRTGENNRITWDTASILSSKVRLEYTVDSGLNWIFIDSAAKGLGSFNWFVPFNNSNKCYIKILNNTNRNLFSVSDTSFSILPAVTIYSPFKGDTFYTCNKTVINFDKTQALTSSFVIEYQQKGLSSWNTIATVTQSSPKSVAYTWTLPQKLSYLLNNDIVIRVYPVGYLAYAAYSDTFHIKNSIGLIYPFTDGDFKPGDTVKISWQTAGTNNSFDIGGTYKIGATTYTNPKFIAAAYLTNTNTYDWIVPANISSFKLSVRDYIDTCKSTSMRYDATVNTLDPIVKFVKGNGGESVTGCSNLTLTWKTRTGIAVPNTWKISYSYIGSGFNPTITVAGSATSYTWQAIDINSDVYFSIMGYDFGGNLITGYLDYSDSAVKVSKIGFKASPNDTIVCWGSAIQLNASAGYTNYTWSPKSGLSDSTIINPIAYTTFDKTYTVKANLGTCVVTDYVNIKRLPEVGVSSIAISADTTNICAGKPITVNSTTIYSGSNAVYEWFINRKLIDSSNNSSFTYNFKQNDSIVCVMYSSLCTKNSFAQSNGIKFRFSYTPIVVNSYLEGCNSVTYKGNVYTTATVVIDTLKFVNGCDSVYNNMNIVINLPTTSNTSKIANITFNWNGTTYTSSGTYSKTFTGGNSKGCDSTAILNLTIIDAGCWYKVSAGATHTLAIKGDGTLWAWGSGTFGQLGNGSTTDKKIPTQVGTANNWVNISAGNNYSMAIKTDGTLWAWGYNFDGQLGNGTTTNRSQPIQIGTANNWSSVATGEGHTLAIKTDGTLWAWGSNVYGQLGDATIVNKTSPIQIGTANNWASIATKSVTSYAIKVDGSLWAWGRNNFGQMGDGTTVNKGTPQQIGNATNWTNVAAGYNHSIATKTNGTLWAWGLNNFMQLGDGTTVAKTAPIQIGSATNWNTIASGFEHSIAIKTDGSLWAWGANSFGQLGDGTSTNRSTPKQIGTATNWASISAGNIFTAATKNDGSVWAWGNNLYYQIGDGTSIDKFLPTFVSNCSNCAAITPTNSTINLSSCGNVVYNGITYTANTTKLDTIKTLQGCDSVYITANITITNTAPTRDTFATVCSSINWYGNVFTKDTIATYTKITNTTSSLTEGFSAGTTAPTGWTYTQISGTYTSAGNFGASSPSLRFAATNDQIITPTLTAPATQLSFWIKSQGASGSWLSVLGYNGTNWVNITNITSFPTNGTTIVYNATSTPALPADLTRFRFVYTKTTGNIAFDDLAVNYNGGISPCDSVITLHLTTKKAISINTNLSGCDSVIYKTKVYKTSANFIDTLRNIELCDSIYNNVNIVINYNFSGKIKHPTKGNVTNVITKISGTVNSTLLASGSYVFNCLPASTVGTIKPSKNNDIAKSNGVTSLDVLLTQRHILNTTKLNSAYKIIAADVNGDRLVNSQDILRIRRLILGTDTTFRNTVTNENRLWAFVDSTYIFTDTTNPFPYKDSISITNLTSNKINQTFIGLKLGDVNYDWNVALARQSTVISRPSTVRLEIARSTNFSGVTEVYHVSVANFKHIAAMQYTLHFDHTKYEFVTLNGFKNLKDIEYNTAQANTTGNIAMLWTDKEAAAKTLADGTIIFTIVLRKKVEGNISFELNNDMAEIEAYNKDLNRYSITLKHITTPQELPNTHQWFYIYPNPTKGRIMVQSKGVKHIEFVDILGRVSNKQIVNSERQIIETNLSKGVYIITATMIDGSIKNEKFIVE
jgi:alpha-tubulin suppressor-like RCC1 family protein